MLRMCENSVNSEYRIKALEKNEYELYCKEKSWAAHVSCVWCRKNTEGLAMRFTKNCAVCGLERAKGSRQRLENINDAITYPYCLYCTKNLWQYQNL